MLVLAMLKNSVLEGYDSLDNSWNYMVYVNARDKEKPYIRTCIKKHFSLFCIFIKTPRMSRLCLLIITHWQDIYNKSCFSHRQYNTQRLLGGLHNHFLALWIYKKQQSDKKRAHMRSPRSCFLSVGENSAELVTAGLWWTSFVCLFAWPLINLIRPPAHTVSP